MFGTKLHKAARTLLISLLITSSVEVSSDTPDLHFVTFIDPPYIFDNKETDKKGLVQIILDTLMENIGITYSLSILPAKRAEITARTVTNTCVLPIEKSQEREVFFSWVSPLIVSNHGLFSVLSKEDITLNTLNDAHPFRIGSYLGSGIGEYLQSFEYHVDFAGQNEANIHKLVMNRIDLWASDILSAQHISRQTGIKITKSKLDFFTTLRAIGCHVDIDDKIIKRMNKQLKSMYQDGTLYTITQQFKADNFNVSR